MKKIFSIVFCFVLIVGVILESYNYLKIKNQNKKTLKQIKLLLSKEKQLTSFPFYNMLSVGYDFYDYIPLKVTDGKKKYLFISSNLTFFSLLFSNNKFPKKFPAGYKIFSKAALLFYFSHSNFFIFLNNEQMNYIKERTPNLIDFSFYEKYSSNLKKYSFRDLLRQFFEKGDDGIYYLKVNNFKDFNEVGSFSAYLFFHYHIILKICDRSGTAYIKIQNNQKQR